MRPISVLIVDDHPVVRQGLRVLLEVQDGIEVAGETGDGPTALALAADTSPDVILLDLKLPGMDGIAVLGELKARGGDARVLVLTSATEPAAASLAVRSGAAGVVYKDVDPDALVRAIRSVHDGHLLFAPEAAGPLVRSSQWALGSIEALTGREREVLAELAKGRSNREIARALGVAEKTVKAHVSSILAKLGVQDRTQAALLAVRHGETGYPSGQAHGSRLPQAKPTEAGHTPGHKHGEAGHTRPIAVTVTGYTSADRGLR
jgi:DNA-binding NarL/FixJ family response regulator